MEAGFGVLKPSFVPRVRFYCWRVFEHIFTRGSLVGVGGKIANGLLQFARMGDWGMFCSAKKALLWRNASNK